MKLLAAFIAVLFCLLPPAAAAEEPETAYGNFHRAILTGNFDELLRYVPRSQRSELERLPPADRDAQLKMMGAVMPRLIRTRNKNVEPSGRAARLVVVGASSLLVAGKPEMLYGTIRMAMEGEDWKVADVNWSNSPPEGMAAEAPPVMQGAQGAPAPQKSVPAPAPPKGAAPVVGSMDSAPERKLGKQKPPCEFKPVMTAEDLENCR